LQARGADVELRNDEGVRGVVDQDSFAARFAIASSAGRYGKAVERVETNPPALPTLASLTVKSQPPRLTITTLSDKFGVEAGKAEQASPERLGLVEVK
jgi:hypothetical protein